MTCQSLSVEPTQKLEDDKVILTRWDFAPGVETGWHRHQPDYMVVPLVDGVMQLHTDEGCYGSDVKASASYHRPADVKHNVINAGEDHFAFVEIEFKPNRESTDTNVIAKFTMPTASFSRCKSRQIAADGSAQLLPQLDRMKGFTRTIARRLDNALS